MSIGRSGLALAAAASLLLFLGAWTTQDAAKKPPPGQDAKKAAPAQEMPKSSRAEHMAAFAKAFPSLKTPLSEAITIAEKARNGKAHGADVELGKDGKLTIEVRLLVGDKFEEVYVDHETKAVTVAEKGKGHDDDDEEGEEHEEHEKR